MRPWTCNALACLLFGLLLAGCAAPPPPPPVGLVDLAERPAEHALLAGMRAYDDAQYASAESELRSALQTGLAAAHDRAAAHKFLAFIACSSQRLGLCEAEFRAARTADPAFALSKAEAGHPVWGPVYQRVRQ